MKMMLGASARLKADCVDAERLLKRLVAQELMISFAPNAEQRLWRTVVRRKYQLTCDRVRLQNQLESLLEEAQPKSSSLVSDLAEGETNPSTLAALADRRPRATEQQLCDALGASKELNQMYRRLAEDGPRRAAPNRTADGPTGPRNCESVEPLSGCSSTAGRGSRTRSGFGTADHRRSGAVAATFPSKKHLASWVGVCPGQEYLLKESLERLWDYHYEGAMINYLQKWMDQLKWQRLKPFEELAAMLLKHLEGIMNYCRTKVRFGVVEAVNANIRMLINRGRGYKNLRYLLLKVKRLAVTNVEFIAVRSMKKAA